MPFAIKILVLGSFFFGVHERHEILVSIQFRTTTQRLRPNKVHAFFVT